MALPSSSSAALRAGAAALAMFVGAFMGLACAIALFAIGSGAPPFAELVFGGACAGIVAGLVLPDEAMSFAEGSAHFLFGALFAGRSAMLDEAEAPAASSRPWLRAACLFGVVYALVIAFLL